MIQIRRGTIALLLGAVLATLLCAACPGRTQPQARARTVPLELGVTVFSMWRDWDQHDLWFRRAADSGVQWLRVDVGWCSLEEAGRGQVSQWYQGRLDVTADAVARLGMKLLVDVACAPGWAGSTRSDSWLTEFGWTTATSGPRPGVDEATQARFLTDAVRQIQNDYPYVTHAFWFCLRDRDDWTPYENGFGLLGVDGTPKPGFAALQRANSMPKEAL